jgi:hypothetical protein
MLLKTQMKTILYATMTFVLLASICGTVNALDGEHPSEHPKGETNLNKDEIADAIVKYVNEKSAEQDGYFIIIDDETDEELKLTLIKVHRGRLSRLGGDEYFACADFMATNAKMYDLDVFMTGKTKDDLEFSKFSIHKVDGKARYTWYEKGGVWKKKYAGDEGFEHPKGEHPKSEHPKSEHPG